MTKQRKAVELLRSVDIASRVTGIGSVPFSDPGEATELILESCPIIPYVPQLIKRDFRENMFLQFSENLPCIGVNHETKHIFFDESIDKEKALAEFYEYVEGNCYEHFKITPAYSSAFDVMLKKCRERSTPFIKTQVTGPITYLLSLINNDKRALIHDADLAEAITLGLAMKGFWQAREIRNIGKIPLLFLDEPSLCELGSAYLPLSSERVRLFIDLLIGFIKERDKDMLIGLHCCGNTDWRMIMDLNIDIVSFDVYGFGDKLILYAEELKRFVEKGGFLAFGIVPTSEYEDGITQEILFKGFVSVLEGFEKKGVHRELLLTNSFFTPSCGMGPLSELKAKRILDLTASLSRRIQNPSATA